MSALSVFMQESTSQRQYPISYMETAIMTYLQTCKYVLYTSAVQLM